METQIISRFLFGGCIFGAVVGRLIAEFLFSDEEFSVCTLNTLATCYAHSMKSQNYPQSVLSWKKRKKLLFSFLQDSFYDIYLLQEVDRNSSYGKLLTGLGYQLVFHRRSRSKSDGCVIAWKSSMFQQVGDPIRVDYNDLINKSKTITNLRFQRDNVGVFVLVRHLESNELILLANTHLYWNPAHADVKLAQISYFTDRIHQFITESNINPKIILGGDLNSIPGSDVVKFLKEGSVSYDQNEDKDIKFCFDTDLYKVCRWVRAIGVDAECFDRNDLNCDTLDDVIQKAKDGGRIIVTRSRSLVNRKNMDRCVFLKSQDANECMEMLIRTFNLTLDPKKCYTRCVACNGGFRKLSEEEANTADIPVDRTCNQGPFFQCLDCGQYYWWGSKTEQSHKKMLDMFQKSTKPLVSTLDAPPTKEELFRTSFECALKLKSSFREEPKWTNVTHTFTGTLDYIFSNSLKIKNAYLPIQTDEAIPHDSWGSDHLPVVAHFGFD